MKGIKEKEIFIILKFLARFIL